MWNNDGVYGWVYDLLLFSTAHHPNPLLTVPN
jgi:hypothetical protein